MPRDLCLRSVDDTPGRVAGEQLELRVDRLLAGARLDANVGAVAEQHAALHGVGEVEEEHVVAERGEQIGILDRDQRFDSAVEVARQRSALPR